VLAGSTMVSVTPHVFTIVDSKSRFSCQGGMHTVPVLICVPVDLFEILKEILKEWHCDISA
jgi:hypothetical protein